MKALRYCIGYALVACATVLVMDVIGMVLMLFLIDIPAVVLDWKEALHVSSTVFRWLAAIGSITLLPGIIGWAMFFANKDRLVTGENRKEKE